MKLFKIIRFYLVWVATSPFVLLYLLLAAAISGQRHLINIKMQLIHQSLYQRFVEEKQEAVSNLMLEQRVKNLTRKPR